MVVVVGIIVETGYITSAHALRVDREAELLFRGQAYRRAIRSYYEAGTSHKTYPPSLDHLLRDPRAPGRRHIRALYTDPMAKGDKKEWNLVRAPDGGISGVASTSKDEPRKQANFPKDLEKLIGAKTYSEWVFEFVPVAIGKPPAVAPPSPSPIGPPTFKTN